MEKTLLIASLFYVVAFLGCYVVVARKEKALGNEGIDRASPEGIAYAKAGRNLKVYFPLMAAGMALCNGLPLPDEQMVYPAILLFLVLGSVWWINERRIARDEAIAKEEKE